MPKQLNNNIRKFLRTDMYSFLFLCSANLLRSPTCEHVARLAGYSATSAGTKDYAVRRVTKEDLERAEVVVCMEEEHKKDALEIYPKANIVVWNIPDIFSYCEPELIALINSKLKEYEQ